MYEVQLVRDTHEYNLDRLRLDLAPETRAMLDAIIRAFPGVKLGRGSGFIQVYFDGDIYTRGGVAIQTPGHEPGHERDLAYFVRSPYIENNVSSHGSDGFYQKRFRKLDGAIKAVKKSFRPLTAEHTVKHRIDHLYSAMSGEYRRLANEARNLSFRDGTRVSCLSSQILVELERHFDAMYDSDIKDKISGYMDLRAEMSGLSGDREFVYMLRHGDGYSTKAFRMDASEYSSSTSKYDPSFGYVSNAGLNSALADKISVLGVLEDDQYLEDVGYKVTDGAYYVSLL